MSNSTNSNNVSTPDNNDTARGSSLPETSPKSKMSKTEYLAMKRKQTTRLTMMLTIDEALASDVLTTWERSFLSDIREAFKKFGLKARITMAQMIAMNRALCKAHA